MSSDTFFVTWFPLLLPNRCCLGENNHKSQSVIEFLLCVAGIKEHKSDTFRVTDRTTFYEMVALRTQRFQITFDVCKLRLQLKQHEINFNGLNLSFSC